MGNLILMMLLATSTAQHVFGSGGRSLNEGADQALHNIAEFPVFSHNNIIVLRWHSRQLKDHGSIHGLTLVASKIITVVFNILIMISTTIDNGIANDNS